MNNLKRYKEITGKEFIGNDYSIEQFQNSKAVSNLIKEIEKLNHYKHLYSEVKEQKGDVVEGLKDLRQFVYDELVDFNVRGSTETYCKIKDLLRMLGEIDE